MRQVELDRRFGIARRQARLPLGAVTKRKPSPPTRQIAAEDFSEDTPRRDETTAKVLTAIATGPLPLVLGETPFEPFDHRRRRVERETPDMNLVGGEHRLVRWG